MLQSPPMVSGQKIGCTFDLNKPIAKSVFIVPPLSMIKHLAGQHDQSSHGNWAHGGELPYPIRPLAVYHTFYNDEIFQSEVKDSTGYVRENVHGIDDFMEQIFSEYGLYDYGIQADPIDINETEDGNHLSLPQCTSKYRATIGLASLAQWGVTGIDPYQRNTFYGVKTTILKDVINDPDYPKIPEKFFEQARTALESEEVYRYSNTTDEEYQQELEKHKIYVEKRMQDLRNRPIGNGISQYVDDADWLAYVRKENAFVLNKVRQIKFKSGETVGEVMDKFAESQLKTLKQMADEQPVVIQTTSARLKRLIADDRFKTVYEVTSAGKGSARSHYLEVRKRGETFLGVPKNTPPEQRPVYGYLANNGADHYGDVRIVLKDEVKTRTTMTIGDSLDGGTRAGLLMSDVRQGKISAETYWNTASSNAYYILSDPSYTNKNFETKKIDRKTKSIAGEKQYWYIPLKSKDKFKSPIPYEYVETQVHGGVKVSDIAEVIITHETAIPKALQSKLIKQGIKVIVQPDVAKLEKQDWAKYDLDTSFYD